MINMLIYDIMIDNDIRDIVIVCNCNSFKFENVYEN